MRMRPITASSADSVPHIGAAVEPETVTHVCYKRVTVRLRSGFTLLRALDPRLTLWLASLAAMSAFNIGLWIWIARSATVRTPYTEVQLLLSGVYVAVCGFRSLFPRVDLERRCLWDTWLSAIMLGRTASTIAELCFALQCGLFVHRLAEMNGSPLLGAGAHAFVPLVLLAELCCWYAVLSLNHIGHAVEESLWALLMLMLSAAFGVAALTAEGSLLSMLVAGCVVYGIGAGLTLAVDVRMYVRRWRVGAGGAYLTLATGLRDSQARRHPTLDVGDPGGRRCRG